VTRFEKIHIRLGNIRLLLAACAAIIGWFAFARHFLSLWWLLAPLAGFICVAAYHSRILRARQLAERAVVFYQTAIARLEDRWDQRGETGERFSDPHHVYSADLDLFGKCSLFQLLSTARTRIGEDTLANWLLAPASLEQIRERHAAVSELRDQLDLREDLAVLGEDVGVGLHPEALTRWAEAVDQMKPLWLRWLSPLLAGLAVAGVAAWAISGMVSPLLIIIVIQAIFKYRLRKPLEAAMDGTEHAFRDLGLLAAVLARVESHNFQTPRLRALQSKLSSNGVSGSEAIARLKTLVDLINSRHNVYVQIIDTPLMYSIQVAFAAERWRRRHGKAVHAWLAAVGEMEALLSFATYSFEHPDAPFPEFVVGDAHLEGVQIGHPLIPPARCVRNDVSLGGETRVLLVSGSNMSGKSTLMRAIGINVVLAMAGAPVQARHLRLTPLQVGASIRVNDSLREGSSRFYAEIARLRQILDLAGGAPPLLFLLDELLQGTNSHDRRIGAEGVVRALIARGSIGLLSTHDLALTDIGGPTGGRLRNVHFQDELENGVMKFDYQLRDGVVTKSNGLELMRSIGLDV
jgi:hypothetical protein